MTRRLIFTLASLTACAVSTLLMSTNFLGKDHFNANNNEHEESEFDYMVGSGAPPPIERSSRTLLPPHAWSEERPGGGRVGRNEYATTDVEESESDAEEAATTAREVEGDEDNNDPRPKKNPKGERWRGWPKDDSPGDRAGGAPPKNEWWRNSRHCFAVDQICHRRKENEWFYYATTSPRKLEKNDDGREDGSNALFQPNMELKSAPDKYDGGKDRGEKRISIKVSSSFYAEPAEISFEDDGLAYVKSNSNDERCRISSSTVHVVLQSLFNDMIGEFYSRTLFGLYRLMKNGVVDANGNDEGKLLPWEEDIQFYVHIAYGNKQMVDGHILLLSGMLSNPDSPPPKSILDLFVQEEEGKHDDGDCQCYEKMVFCGYNVYTHDNDVLSKDMEPAVNDVGGSEDIQEVLQFSKEDDAPISRSFNYDPKTKFTLWSAARVGDSDLGSCGRSSNLDGEEYACREWSGLRYHLAANFLTHYPTLEVDIVEKRREYLLERGFVDEGYRDNTDEFTVIGLTQRTYRRAWINLPDIIEKCNEAAFERVVCVEVNVETTSSPYEQLILHRSLDAMIGVHGAQLTQGILLPPHAHVLELLPWIPDYIRGGWVKTTHSTTPLGVIFHNTDLNHLGYSLDRSSVPLCEGVPKDQEESCFLRQRKTFVWENRDFAVESDAILRYIEKFVLFVRERERACDELMDALDERFVMYNIWCVKPKYWFPRFPWGGDKGCIHGSWYPVDHTDSSKKDVFLFDKREDCCTAFPHLCDTESQNIHHTLENSTISLWHNYHHSPLTKGKKKKRRNRDYNPVYPAGGSAMQL